MLLSFVQWLQATTFFTALRGSGIVYPVVLSLHLTGIALFGGLIAMTDLRLLGVAMKDRPISAIVDQFRWPKRIGLLIVVTCGFLLFGSKAEEYYYNTFFWTKMSLLCLVAVHALIFRPTVYNRAAEIDKLPSTPGNAKLAGVLSMLIWISIACCGRGIGYIEPPLDKIHAMLERAPQAIATLLQQIL